MLPWDHFDVGVKKAGSPSECERARLEQGGGAGGGLAVARVRVAAVGEVPAGEGRVVEADGRALALFNVEGAYHCLDNVCPHRGGPLGEGDLEGRLVSCPWHAWRWT